MRRCSLVTSSDSPVPPEWQDVTAPQGVSGSGGLLPPPLLELPPATRPMCPGPWRPWGSHSSPGAVRAAPGQSQQPRGSHSSLGAVTAAQGQGGQRPGHGRGCPTPPTAIQGPCPRPGQDSRGQVTPGAPGCRPRKGEEWASGGRSPRGVSWAAPRRAVGASDVHTLDPCSSFPKAC